MAKTVSSDNLARFKAKCDETYEKKGEGGGTNPSIPTPTTADNGKVLGVTNGAYALQEAGGGGGTQLYLHFGQSSPDINGNYYYLAVISDYQYEYYSEPLKLGQDLYNNKVIGFYIIDKETYDNAVASGGKYSFLSFISNNDIVMAVFPAGQVNFKPAYSTNPYKENTPQGITMGKLIESNTVPPQFEGVDTVTPL